MSNACIQAVLLHFRCRYRFDHGLEQEGHVVAELVRFRAGRTVEGGGVDHREVQLLVAGAEVVEQVEYLVDLSIHFDAGTVHVKDWQAMDDEAIIAELIAIRGIGRWTAEMFLIFYLRRPNVLPLDDIGLINGISKNYFSGESVSRSDAREVAAAWAPFCSVATWYIWRSLDPLPVLGAEPN